MGLSITLIIVIMTAIISWQAIQDPAMKAKLFLRPTDIKNRGEYYRFLSSGLVHADIMHLLVNMYVLFTFGQVVERILQDANLLGDLWGRLVFILFYFSAIVVASIPDYMRHQDNYGYAALGASGATSAMVFAYIALFPWSKLTFLFLPFLQIPAILLGVGYLWYSSYMDKRGTDNIGHNAHFWGGVYGWVFIYLVIWLANPLYFKFIVNALLAGPFSEYYE